MKKDLIEVFVEKNCPSCEEIVFMLTQLTSVYKLEIHIYRQEHDLQLFLERHVLICPATFLNGRLVFYGSFTLEDLTNKLTFNKSLITEGSQ